MKLIYLANARIPTEKAHGLQIMKMCEAFATAGLEVELIVPWRFNKIKENPFDYYGTKRNFKIKKLPSLDLMPLKIPKICFWIQELSFALVAFFYLLFRKADLIYSRNSSLLYLLSLIKNNLVYEAHTFPRNFFLHRSVFKRVRKIIVITRSLKQSLIKKGINQDKIMVAPDGVDIEMFDVRCSMLEARENLGLPRDKKIVLYTGHLYQWKGAKTLLEAARKFLISNFKFLNALFVFVGGTETDIESFRQKAQGLNNVMIVGHRPHSEIPYWLKAADVLVLPNSAQEQISQFWTSPMKMFEYMASQRPIVASDLPSIREILDENNAILVKPDSPQSLAQGIERILKNSDFSVKISRQAYQDVQKYTWQRRAGNILDFICEISEGNENLFSFPSE